MRLQFRLSLRHLVLALIALFSFGAIVIKQSDQALKVSAAVQTVETVNAASQEKGPVAPGSLVSTFGNKLATQTEKSQSGSPPTELGGVTIKIVDSANVSHDAPLVYVSPKQINYLIPSDVALGAAQVAIRNGDGVVAQGKLEIVASAPALFTKGSGERKTVAAMASSNGEGFQSAVEADGSPRMVSLGAPWDPTTLTLLATGLGAAQDVKVRIGNEELTPKSVSQDDETPGVTQIQVALPMTLSRGMTDVTLVVNTQSSGSVGALAASGATQSTATVQASNTAQLLVQPPAPPGPNVLSAADVQTIIAQAVAKAQQMGFLATIAVVDKEGNALGVFKMNGARNDVLLGSTNLLTGQPSKSSLILDPDGLERVTLPLPGAPPGLLSDGAALAAISKAGTAAFFSTQGSSITTRTASFIIQENFPPGVSSQPGGPLFGVQFSQLPCSDFRGNVGLSTLPLGLAGDPGGVGIYKNGVAVGGVGVEGDGFYSIDIDPSDFDRAPEEDIAIAAIKGYRPPPAIQIDRVLIDGMRLPYVNTPPPGDGPPAPPFNSLPGQVIVPISGQLVSRFTPLTLGGIPGRVIVDPNPGAPSNVNRQGYFPFKSSQVSSLTADDVTRIITQAAQQAFRTRAAIRIPVGSVTEVNITVVDTSGAILGEFSTQDAPEFGFDVSAQKARTAVLFSIQNTETILRSANANSLGLSIGKYADAAIAFGAPINGQFAFTSRSMGFLARPFFPDGINGAPNGPFSKPFPIWSPFNDGLQIALVKPALVSILTGGTPANGNCSPIANTPLLSNGLQIFAGSALLFKNGALVGAIGISGDGIDQDDACAGGGSFSFEAPPNVRADQIVIGGAGGVRLPYLKYPRALAIRNINKQPVILRGARPFANMN